MTVGEWEERAEECRLAGDRLIVTRAEYAGLCGLKLCSVPANPRHTAEVLFGVPLVVR